MKRLCYIKPGCIMLACGGLSQAYALDTDHLYIGGGLSTLIASNTVNLYRASSGGTFQSFRDSGNAFGGQVFVGYQKFYAKHFLSAEAGLRGMIGRSSGDKSNDTVDTPRVSMPITATITFKPGARLANNNLLYGMFGVAVSKISMYQTYNNIPFSMNAWRPGILLGLGVQLPLSNKYSMSVSYSYEWYNGDSKYFAGNNFTDRLKPNSQVVSLNIIDSLK